MSIRSYLALNDSDQLTLLRRGADLMRLGAKSIEKDVFVCHRSPNVDYIGRCLIFGDDLGFFEYIF